MHTNLSVVVTGGRHLSDEGVDRPNVSGASVTLDARVQGNFVVVGGGAGLKRVVALASGKPFAALLSDRAEQNNARGGSHVVAVLGHEAERDEEFALVVLSRGADDG
jgi:hypothetical protein